MRELAASLQIEAENSDESITMRATVRPPFYLSKDNTNKYLGETRLGRPEREARRGNYRAEVRPRNPPNPSEVNNLILASAIAPSLFRIQNGMILLDWNTKKRLRDECEKIVELFLRTKNFTMATIQELMHYPNEVTNLYEVGRHGFKSQTIEYALSIILKCFNACLYEFNHTRNNRDHSILDKSSLS